MSKTPAGPATKRERISIERRILISRWRLEMVSILIKTSKYTFAMASYRIGLSWFAMGFVSKKIPMNMYGSNTP